MKRPLAKALSGLGGLVGACSAGSWILSARAGKELLTATDPKLITYWTEQSAVHNWHAAWLAAFAGVLIVAAIFFDD